MLGGIDIGGTKIAVCTGDAAGGVHRVTHFAFDRDAEPGEVLARAAESLRRMADEAGTAVGVVGVTCPGPFDGRGRRFYSPPNMPRWHGFDVGAALDRALGVTVRTMNDANAAALAEHLWGGHGACHTLVFLTHSTGFGAGVVIEGRVLEGAHGLAGEIGRVRLADDGPAGYGALGTVEGFASGRGMAQLAETEARRCEQCGEATGLRGPGELSADLVCRLAAGGDAAARRVIERSAQRVGEAVAVVANLFDPDVVVLGTIASAHPGLFIPWITEAMRRNTVREIAERVRVTTSRLTDRGAKAALAAAVATLA